MLYFYAQPILRYDFGQLLQSKNLNGIGVEVGVLKGHFSEMILNTSELKLLVSVDTWPREDYRKEAFERLQPYDRSICLRAPSHVAAQIFADQSLDFAYIDADHGFESAQRDIHSWWPKMKPGGLFSGHDYSDYHPSFGVVEAVDQFVLQFVLELNITGGQHPSWYLFKP